MDEPKITIEASSGGGILTAVWLPDVRRWQATRDNYCFEIPVVEVGGPEPCYRDELGPRIVARFEACLAAASLAHQRKIGASWDPISGADFLKEIHAALPEAFSDLDMDDLR